MRICRLNLALLLTLAVAGCWRGRPTSDAELAVLSGVCASLPGLERAASVVAELQQRSSTPALLVAGDTFVSAREPQTPEGFTCARRKLTAVTELLARLHPLAVARGPLDMGVHEAAITSSASAG